MKKKVLKGYPLIMDRVTEIYAIINVAHGVLRQLMQSGALKEDKKISKKFFPKGGLKLVDEHMIEAYRAVQAALIEYERMKK
jgi:hypothetical protein